MKSKDSKPEQATELRRQAGEIARKKAAQSPENLEAQSPEEMRQMIHELCVHKIELEMQNEELRRVQAELDAARVRYFDLYDLAPVGYVTVSEQGMILEANLATETLLGVARAAMIKQLLTRFVLKEDQDNYYLHRKQLFETGEPQAWELRMVKNDGTAFWARLEATAAQDAGGAPVCRIMLSDMTERKQAEAALRESEEWFRSFVENANDIIYTLEPNGIIIYISPNWKAILGHDAHEVIGQSFARFVHPDDVPACRAFLERIITTGEKAGGIEYRIQHKDGTWRWHSSNGSPMSDAGGKLIGYMGIARDITERKQAEEALRKSEEKYSKAFLTSPYAITITRLKDGKYIEFNDAFTSITGFTREEVIANSSVGLNLWVDIEERKQVVSALLEGREVYGMECLFNKKNGEIITGSLSAKIIYLNNESFILSSIEDITERKRAEEEKANLEGQLQQAQKMESVGRLAGGVAHDFNNMLSVILGHAELALEQVDPAQPLHNDLMEIRKAAVRSADLTRQLLAFARKQTVAPKVLDLNETVAGMLKMLQRLIGEDIDLNWQPAADLWPVKVDPSQIDQILANLCVNARDAIADIGRITIETGNSVFDADYCADHAGFEPGEYVLIAVSDNGCGMDKETMSHIFEPFFTTKGVGKGTGLGLATVYGSVKQNNGFINAYSEPGLGTTFKIYLPRHAGKAGQMQNKGQATLAARGHETVLLVEDEPAILKLTKVMLERQGYIVLAASTPGEAIRLSREHAGEIHLLMTDVVMPEMNGRDLAKNLLSLYPDLKRLFMSGYTANVIAHHGVLDEGVYFIQKPFSMEDLAAKVREALDR